MVPQLGENKDSGPGNWGNKTAGRMFALIRADPELIPGTTYGLQNPRGIIPEHSEPGISLSIAVA